MTEELTGKPEGGGKMEVHRREVLRDGPMRVESWWSAEDDAWLARLTDDEEQVRPFAATHTAHGDTREEALAHLAVGEYVTALSVAAPSPQAGEREQGVHLYGCLFAGKPLSPEHSCHCNAAQPDREELAIALDILANKLKAATQGAESEFNRITRAVAPYLDGRVTPEAFCEMLLGYGVACITAAQLATPVAAPREEVERDAARWAFVREHFSIGLDEDNNLCFGGSLGEADDAPYLTQDEVDEISGNKVGARGWVRGDVLDRAVDYARGTATPPASREPEGEPRRDVPENVVTEAKIPRGGIAHEIVVTRTEVVVLGSPDDETGDENDPAHDCDALGCGGAHVLLRIPLYTRPPQGVTEAELLSRVETNPNYDGGGFVRCDDASIAVGSLLRYAAALRASAGGGA